MPALYRKWRPQKFSELVGQDHVKETLVNALSTNRIVHAYLFSGPRGSGKTTTARLLAKGVNCQNFKNREPCNQCFSCLEIQKGQSLDLIEIDAASNRGIDEIKDLREKVKFTPSRTKYKVFVIDEVHMLTREAFNALLKTLEEPPSHVIFVLATTEAHKVPPTILSRCQRFDFRRLTVFDLVKRISYVAKKEGFKMDEETKKLIARSSEGSARDADGFLDLILSNNLSSVSKEDAERILGKTEMEKIEELYQLIKKKDTASALSLLNQITEEGKDLFQFSSNLIEYLREKLLQNPSLSLVSWIKIISQAQREMKTASFLPLPLELAIVEICQPEVENLRQGQGETQKDQPKADQPLAEKTKQTRVDSSPAESKLDWEKVISEIKSENHSLCFLLRNCHPLEIKKDGQVILGVNFKFHKDKIEEAKNQKMIEETIKKVMGKDCKICCKVIKGNPKAGIKNSQNEDLLNEAKEVFEVEDI